MTRSSLQYAGIVLLLSAFWSYGAADACADIVFDVQLSDVAALSSAGYVNAIGSKYELDFQFSPGNGTGDLNTATISGLTFGGNGSADFGDAIINPQGFLGTPEVTFQNGDIVITNNLALNEVLLPFTLDPNNPSISFTIDLTTTYDSAVSDFFGAALLYNDPVNGLSAVATQDPLSGTFLALAGTDPNTFIYPPIGGYTILPNPSMTFASPPPVPGVDVTPLNQPPVVPEPSTLALMGIGLIGLMRGRRRRRIAPA